MLTRRTTDRGKGKGLSEHREQHAEQHRDLNEAWQGQGMQEPDGRED